MKELYKALAAFQQECPAIHKGTKGYGYSYASLPEILEVINPLMKKHGLGFYQALVPHAIANADVVGGDFLYTEVFHIETGKGISSYARIPNDVELKGMNKYQVFGSAVTYFRRYALSAMLGIVTDADNDAAEVKQDKKGEWL